MPRRVSGPATGRTRPQASPRHSPTVGARALAVVRSLPHHSLIDRLVRGRAWIPVLGVLLAGLVAMQVEILKLGTSMGRSIERTTSLQSKNDSLRASIAALADDRRIERLAAGLGMVTPSPGILTFVHASPQGQPGRALGNIHLPDPTGFATQLASQLAAATLLAPPAPSTTGSGQTTSGPAGTASTGVSPATTGATTGTSSTGSAGTTAGPQTTTGAGGTTTGAAGTSTGAAATPGGASGTSTTGTGATAGVPSSSGTTGGGPAAGGAGLSSSTSQSGSPAGP